MSAALKLSRFTPKEYLAIERNAEFRSEYQNGILIAMAGGTFDHAKIAGNINGSLFAQLLGSPCTALQSDIKIGIETTKSYRYPDVVVVCGPPEYEDDARDVLLNPTVVMEVISPSTQKRDRTVKLLEYQSVPSIKEILHVEQDQPFILRYLRDADGYWKVKIFSGMDAVLEFGSIPAQISFTHVYDRIEFPPPAVPE